MKKWLNKNKLYLLGMLVGAIGGFLYWKYVGCSSGTCMITSKPINSTAYGALMGALLFGMFKKENKQQQPKEEA
jgi:glucose uptake protein GlcU